MHYKYNTDDPLNLYISYPIMSLLEVKLLLNLNLSKLYNYNKMLKCTNIKFWITILSLFYVIIYIKYYRRYVSPCSCIMEEIRIPTEKETIQLNIYRIHMEMWCKMKSIIVTR